MFKIMLLNNSTRLNLNRFRYCLLQQRIVNYTRTPGLINLIEQTPKRSL